MPTTTQRIIELLEPHLPKEYQGMQSSHEVLEDDQPLLFNIIIWLLTHTSEGEPCKDGDVPCVLGELNPNIKKMEGLIKEWEGLESELIYRGMLERDYKERKTKAQVFLSYENLQLGEKAFMEKFLGELENEQVKNSKES